MYDECLLWQGGCLEAEIMPFLPEAMERLLKQPDARELYDFLPLVNQIIMKFKVRYKMLFFQSVTFVFYSNSLGTTTCFTK